MEDSTEEEEEEEEWVTLYMDKYIYKSSKKIREVTPRNYMTALLPYSRDLYPKNSCHYYHRVVREWYRTDTKFLCFLNFFFAAV